MRSILLTAVALFPLASFATAAQVRTPQEPVDEVRGIWLTHSGSKVLSSRRGIALAMEFLEQANINVVFPVVWTEGATLYPSDVAKRVLGTRQHPTYEGRDVLQEVIEEAHAYGIAVVPWFENGSTTLLPGKEKREDPFAKKTAWLAIGRGGKPVEGETFRWLNTLDAEVQEFVTELMLEVATKYDVEGVQTGRRLLALPATAGYDKRTLANWKSETGNEVPTDPARTDWIQWRADRITSYAADLRGRLREAKPDLIFSAFVAEPGTGLSERLQDSSRWLDRGLVDWIHPEVFHRDSASYTRNMQSIVDEHFGSSVTPRLFPAILLQQGKYVISGDSLVACIEWNRAHGIRGEILYFYEGMLSNKELLKALVTGPYARPAVLPRLPKPSAAEPK